MGLEDCLDWFERNRESDWTGFNGTEADQTGI